MLLITISLLIAVLSFASMAYCILILKQTIKQRTSEKKSPNDTSKIMNRLRLACVLSAISMALSIVNAVVEFIRIV